MDGIHDMGGMHGFGPIDTRADDLAFHAEWEGRVFAINLAMMAVTGQSLDAGRAGIESLPETSEQRSRAFLPESLTDEGEPVFAEPWEAQAFAMTESLFERGLFSWPEWTHAFSAKRAARAAPGEDWDNSFYYHDWLTALETLVSERAGIEPSALADLRERWEEAYRSTPHGEAVVL